MCVCPLLPSATTQVFDCIFLFCLWLLFSLLSLTGRKKTWEFIRGNIDELKKRLGGAFLLSRVLEMTTNSFACEETAKEIEVRMLGGVGWWCGAGC